ncbi:MAG: hypothetical protein F4170_06110 [Rhodobacteraceae bacterium]|nr:hypothetical protein [Paracoccaceae bacterium]MYG10404.1 hypothetical protein [Paracoccaceae bacterium]
MQEDIDKILKEFVQKHLEPAEIVNLISREDEDADGDPIMRIRVVYNPEKNPLDPNKTLSLTRHLRQKMGNIFIERFPIFYFVTKEEDKTFAGY